MTDLGIAILVLQIGGGFILFIIGIVITRAIFSIGKIVWLLEKIADSLAEPEKPSIPEVSTDKSREIACPNCGKPKVAGAMCQACGSWAG